MGDCSNLSGTHCFARSKTDTIFQTYEWVTSWFRWHEDCSPLVLVARGEDGVIRGIAPLMITHPSENRRHGLVRFIGTPSCDYSDFIISDDVPTVVESFLDHLRRRRPREDIRLLQIPKRPRRSRSYDS